MGGILVACPQRVLVIGAFLLLHVTQLNAQATSREEEIRQQRTDKRARLWPERTSGIVQQVNKYTERGLLEGARSGKGTNGPQFLLGGMRSGNGTSFGVGYRRVDLWGERLGFRTTVRGTPAEAYMFDAEVNFPRLNTRRSEVRVYAKYENSPQMDYYGPGQDSNKDDRTSYRLEDAGIDFTGRYRVWKGLWLGATGGFYVPNTGPGKRSGFPSTEETFTPEQTPSLDDQPDFLRAGFTVQYDYRDLPTGPREGGNYYLHFKRYWDQELGRHTFNQWDTAVEQYFPYWNKTRVVAVRLAMIATQVNEGQTVPFYLQPTLGGNEVLRGFARYRFHDQSALWGAVEHRWHLFSGGHAAVFAEVGKVAPKATQLNLARANYAGGIGFRFTLRDAVVMRLDNAVSNEGYRFMWTFSNVW
jgi:outer membrane protein assembly factor BamA